MTYHNPHAIVTKFCALCSTEFESPAYYNKLYCSDKCFRAAKHKRRVNRDNPPTPTKLQEQAAQIKDAAPYFATVYCPSPTQLNNFAQLILLEMNDGKPIRLTGVIPEWKPPKNIVITEQVGSDPKEWVMTYREPSPLDDLLAR